MFDFLKRRLAGVASEPKPAIPLHFKDCADAFEYACKYMDCALREGTNLPAIVVDPSVAPDGNQIVVLRVASSDGGFLVVASTIGPSGPTLRTGQLVAWTALQYVTDVAKVSDDRRFGWVGFIVGTLKPEYRDGNWVGDERFTA